MIRLLATADEEVMPVSPKAQEKGGPVSLESAAAGILALMVDARARVVTSDKKAVKTEVLLATAGLSVEEIVAVTRRNPDAVRKTIQRGRGQ